MTEKKTSAEAPEKKKAAKAAASKTGRKKKTETSASDSSTVDVKAVEVLEKAAASKESDLKSAARKISELDKQRADASVRSKEKSEDLKARAHEARKRAQQKILEKSFVSDPPEDPLERLANTFDNSARRWEMVVYPSLFAFVLLAGYGFFLIYRLTHDIATLSQSVTHMAVIVSDAMPRMTRDLNTMTDSMDNMTGNIAGMTQEVESMSGQMTSLTPMSKNIQSMTHNIGSMNRSVYGMQRDMHGMNRTVSSGPFGMMNDMLPFSSSTNVPPPVPPSPVWPAYGNPQPYNYYRPLPQPVPQAAPGTAARPAQGVASKTTSPVNTPLGKKTQPAESRNVIRPPGTGSVSEKQPAPVTQRK
ncbi:MAG TPA: hypothetical protein ENJ11_06730 [Gammaproteobacteria bacterium]|nr:hypothetical protein [Gammaproteobacteria bacterium]